MRVDRRKKKRRQERLERWTTRQDEQAAAYLQLSDGSTLQVVDDGSMPQILADPENVAKELIKQGIDPEALAAINKIAEAMSQTANVDEDMRALGVPSFSQWLENKGVGVIDKAAQSGKPGAFLLLKLMKESMEQQQQ